MSILDRIIRETLETGGSSFVSTEYFNRLKEFEWFAKKLPNGQIALRTTSYPNDCPSWPENTYYIFWPAEGIDWQDLKEVSPADFKNLTGWD